MTTDPTARIAEIRKRLDARNVAHGRYYSDYRYRVGSDKPGGCDEDIETMHRWEDGAAADMAFLLDTLEDR